LPFDGKPLTDIILIERNLGFVRREISAQLSSGYHHQEQSGELR
jgi:hypothetical protein